MPFPDEITPNGVQVESYRPAWAGEAQDIADRLREVVPAAVAVEHIGSTSIPGMSANSSP